MNNKQNSDKKWKEALLKSCLPLELLVTEKIENSNFDIDGEYPYIRINEQGIETEFSVDLHASKSFDMAFPEELITHVDQALPGTLPPIATLDILVECKYNYPGVEWVFLPKTDFNGGCVYQLDYKSVKYPGVLDIIKALDNSFKSCSRGIELHANGFDPNTIYRGLSQLRYALPNLIAEEMQMNFNEEIQSHFFCLILVTTADLHILKPNIDIQTYQSVTSLDEISEKVEALVAVQEIGPDLRKYWQKTIDKFALNNFKKK